MVEVRPIQTKKWHDKVGKDSFTQSKIIEVLFDTRTGKYKTGLTEDEAEKYGKIMGVDLNDTFHYEEPHPYWSSKKGQIRLENVTKLFNPLIPSDYVKIKNMEASKSVANSMEEYEQGLWPEATHVIYNEDEEVAKKANIADLEAEAIIMASKMDADQKTNLIQLLSNKSVRGRSTNHITAEVRAIIQKDPSEFIRFAKMDKADVNIRATLLEGIHRNILTKEGQAIFYMGDQLGQDFESTVEWFANPQNAKAKVAILQKLTK